MNSLALGPVHQQAVPEDRGGRIWSALTVIAFILAAGLIARALDIPNFLQVGLATEPPRAQAAETGAERGGVWRLIELVY